MYHANLEAKEIDIDIRYLKRDELPDQLRPKASSKKKTKAQPIADPIAPTAPPTGAPNYNELFDQQVGPVEAAPNVCQSAIETLNVVEAMNVGEKRSYQQMTTTDLHNSNQATNSNQIIEAPRAQEGLYDDNFDEIEDYELA